MGNCDSNEEQQQGVGDPAKSKKYNGRFGFVIFKSSKNAQQATKTSVVYKGIPLLVKQARHRPYTSTIDK